MKFNSKKFQYSKIETNNSPHLNDRKRIQHFKIKESKNSKKLRKVQNKLKMKKSLGKKNIGRISHISKKKSKRNKAKYPWMTKQSFSSHGLLKLHYEIYEFFKFIKPGPVENKKMKEAYVLIKELIEDKWPTWNVEIFGSFPVDLHLRDSDIDVVVFKSEFLNFSRDDLTSYDYIGEYEHLYLILEYLFDLKLFEDIKFIDARIPIIKLIAPNGVKIDISYI